jgi:hypothetical protein
MLAYLSMYMFVLSIFRSDCNRPLKHNSAAALLLLFRLSDPRIIGDASIIRQEATCQSKKNNAFVPFFRLGLWD